MGRNRWRNRWWCRWRRERVRRWTGYHDDGEDDQDGHHSAINDGSSPNSEKKNCETRKSHKLKKRSESDGDTGEERKYVCGEKKISIFFLSPSLFLSLFRRRRVETERRRRFSPLCVSIFLNILPAPLFVP